MRVIRNIVCCLSTIFQRVKLDRLIGFDLIGLQQEYERSFDGYRTTSDELKPYEQARIRRTHIGVRFLGGYMVPILKGLNLEFIWPGFEATRAYLLPYTQ